MLIQLKKEGETLYVGAACHPQPSVTGVADRLNEKDTIIEEELML